MNKINRVSLVALLVFVPAVASAHREIYHIDPRLTEHAHMEYEAVVGTEYLKQVAVSTGRQDLIKWEVEGNLPVTPNLSLEVVQSFGRLTQDDTGFALGDLEAEPRWVFYDSPKMVWNAGVPFLIPIGDVGKGLSEDHYEAEPTIRFDLFLPNVDIYSNSSIGIGLDHRAWSIEQKVAALYLGRVTPDVTLSPFVELGGKLATSEGDRIISAVGFGGAWREWFALVEFEQPILYEDGPDWVVAFHFGYHRVKRH